MKKEKSIFDKHREEIAKRKGEKQYASSPIRMPAAVAKPDPEETYYKGYTTYLERFSALDSDGLDGSEL